MTKSGEAARMVTWWRTRPNSSPRIVRDATVASRRISGAPAPFVGAPYLPPVSSSAHFVVLRACFARVLCCR
eukprot:1768636-Prymnesium_polylepis.1